jgi:antitoxin ParD1/3/4
LFIPIAQIRASPYTDCMTQRKTISLTERDDKFIADQLEKGAFGNASEVVRAGLHLLEQQQLELETLRRAIANGDAAYARGEFTRYSGPGQLAADLKSKLLKDQGPSRR